MIGAARPLLDAPSASYFEDCRRFKLLTMEEEQALARKSRAGDLEARKRLVLSNLRLVVKIALEYRGYHMPLSDLVQEGNCGLVRAVDKFDPLRGVRLISYAAWWIHSYIRKYLIENWALVRMGTTQSQRKLFFSLRRARQRLGPEIEADAAARHAAIAQQLRVKPQVVAEMEVRLSGHELPLDAPSHPELDITVGERLAGEDADPEQLLGEAQERRRRRRWLARALKALSPRERLVARQRFMSERAPTLAMLGLRLGVSRERVRQIELKAKAKLETAWLAASA